MWGHRGGRTDRRVQYGAPRGNFQNQLLVFSVTCHRFPSIMRRSLLARMVWIPNYAGFELLIIDELGFDKLEREEHPQAPSLLYKVIDSRTRKRSTALVTNIDFEGWGKYLGDPPMAMALLDRVVDGAIIHKFQGKSYRAHRAVPAQQLGNASTAKRRAI
jgi:DNA replication protein DnaC